ncbi:uncharacterized protein LOC113253631 [Ursus arctos]|uniref:uncharacterized protein LOC113253631 n=1 Tax=Ursus arctos TaxID=9644 RepID=UPI0025495D3A|nr:uncharacterized protein LOC113253631 [Ursus arctos]
MLSQDSRASRERTSLPGALCWGPCFYHSHRPISRMGLSLCAALGSRDWKMKRSVLASRSCSLAGPSIRTARSSEGRAWGPRLLPFSSLYSQGTPHTSRSPPLARYVSPVTSQIVVLIRSVVFERQTRPAPGRRAGERFPPRSAGTASLCRPARPAPGRRAGTRPPRGAALPGAWGEALAFPKEGRERALWAGSWSALPLPAGNPDFPTAGGATRFCSLRNRSGGRARRMRGEGRVRSGLRGSGLPRPGRRVRRWWGRGQPQEHGAARVRLSSVSWQHVGDPAPLDESHRKLKARAPYRASASCLHFTDEETDPKKRWEVTKAAFLNSGTWDQIQLLLAWFRYSFSEHLSSSWMRCTKCRKVQEGAIDLRQ